VTSRAPDEPTAWKIKASVHLMLPFSVAVSQRLFGCLRLFIPPPLTHLRVLDCVEVQRSARHLENHIQAIQELNCSSIDLTCFVCVLSVRLSLELSECKVCLPCEVILEWIKLYKVEDHVWFEDRWMVASQCDE
jgi:hypothetical protein